MDKNTMLTQLHSDYQEIRAQWQSSLEELNAALDSLFARRNQLKTLKDDLELMKAHAILGETHKDGAINGRNAETRKLQTTTLLAHLQEHDPEWQRITENIAVVETAVSDAELRIEKARAQISYLRNQARMIAGLASALTG